MGQDHSTRQIRWATPFCLIGICALLGAVLGAATNVTNSIVSPYYFRVVLWLWPVSDVRPYAIVQGAREGAALGLFFGLVFAAATAWTSRMRARARWALDVVPWVFVIVLACWAAGGIVSVALAAAFPGFYQSAFLMVPAQAGERLRYAWVGGSIWGAYVGTLVAAIAGCVMIRRRWVRTTSATPGYEVRMNPTPPRRVAGLQ